MTADTTVECRRLDPEDLNAKTAKSAKKVGLWVQATTDVAYLDRIALQDELFAAVADDLTPDRAGLSCGPLVKAGGVFYRVIVGEAERLVEGGWILLAKDTRDGKDGKDLRLTWELHLCLTRECRGLRALEAIRAVLRMTGGRVIAKVPEYGREIMCLLYVAGFNRIGMESGGVKRGRAYNYVVYEHGTRPEIKPAELGSGSGLKAALLKGELCPG